MTDLDVGENIFDLFGANETDAENGKWFKFGKKMEVRIRRFKSKKSRKVREQLEAPYKRAVKFGASLPEDVQEEIGILHVARGLIVDWKGVLNKDKEEIPYSVEAAEKMCRLLPEFRDAVADISLSLDNFREETKEEIVGN